MVMWQLFNVKLAVKILIKETSLKWTYGLLSQDYRIAALCTFYLTIRDHHVEFEIGRIILTFPKCWIRYATFGLKNERTDPDYSKALISKHFFSILSLKYLFLGRRDKGIKVLFSANPIWEGSIYGRVLPPKSAGPGHPEAAEIFVSGFEVWMY